jgi:hypothetical protein
MLVRVWAFPFVVIGWVVGVIAQALALGWGFVFDDPMISWAVKATSAPRPAPRTCTLDCPDCAEELADEDY